MKLTSLVNWQPPKNWLTISTLDMHTEGEPLRIITNGLPEIKGNTILEKRSYLRNNLDYIRTALMWEPRGHADMYGCIITEPERIDSDFGVIFLHNEGYSTMCGHAIIAVTKIAVETGLVEKTEPETCVKIDAPAGQITSYAKIKNSEVDSVYFHNVPSFLYAENKTVDVSEIGLVEYDIAFGGAFYAFVDADNLGINMGENNYPEFISKGMAIKNAVMAQTPIIHPFEEELNFLYGTIFYGKPHNTNVDSRNVCIFADGEVDRSPTGTGVSARAALHFAKGDLKLNEVLTIESILGTTFTTSPIKEVMFDKFNAVIPEVKGKANITGKNQFYIDPNDQLKNGFILR